MDIRQQINQIIFENKIVESELANDLHIAITTFHYQLHTAKNFDLQLGERIFAWLKHKGYAVSESEKCDRVVRSILNINAMVGHGISVLNTEIGIAYEDNRLTFKEKKHISNSIDTLEADLMNGIGDLRKLIEQ